MKYFNYLDKGNGYLFSKFSNKTLLSTSFVLLTKNLLGKKINNEVELIEYFLSSQNEEGYFIDKNYHFHEHEEHGPNYVIPQFTFFSLLALEVLGVDNVKLSFVENLTEDSLKLLLKNSLSKNFWATSNELMFIMYFIAYNQRNNYDFKYEKYNRIIFKFLNENQNELNGFWGDDITTPSIFGKAYGAAHIYLFYDYYGINIPRVEKIIDSCLNMHSKNGLIQSLEGGACEDYDIVEIYYRCLKQNDYRKDEILEKLKIMRKTILKEQKSDGSFSYKFYLGNKVYRFCDKKYKNTIYRYSSWDYMETPIYQSDTWGTFFRYLTLALIDIIVEGRSDYKSVKLPGWGYL